MSGAALRKLTQVAQAERLQRLSADLAQAVGLGDLGRIAALDHAIRSTVMAMMGEGAPRNAADVAALSSALDGLDGAVKALRAAQRRGRQDGGIRALYLAPQGAGA
jgi:hypothetical protein